MKKLVSLTLALMMILSTISFGASFKESNGNTKMPTAVTLKDLNRLCEVATEVHGTKANIVNAQKYNGLDTTWIVRFDFGNKEYEDMVVNCYPYHRDPKSQQIDTLPFPTTEEGMTMFGPSWFWCGLFDDIFHNSCGFMIAERLKRWPDWKDMTFTGTTFTGKTYTGAYTQPSSYEFGKE